MNDQQKNILIGIFLVIAMAIAVSIVLFMEPKIGDGKQVLQVRFANITGLSVGTQVKLAGKTIGEVTRISVVKNAREEPPGPQKQIYYYQLTLNIDSSVKIYKSDEISIKTTGLLGEKSISITPRLPEDNNLPKLVDGTEILYAQSTDSVDNALNNIADMSSQIKGTIKNIDTWFVANEDNLSIALNAFGKTMEEAKTTLETINDEKVINSIKIAADNFSCTMEMVQDALLEIEDRAMIAKFSFILDNAADFSQSLSTDGVEILGNVKNITEALSQGKGTLGQLIQNDDLYLRFSAVMSKTNTLLNDINHYGLLFQYRKDWQRERTKRANMINALDTPAQFKNYFETEVDSINTSLGRLTVLLDKAGLPEEKERILASPQFKKDFLQLLATVRQLLDSLKLYNEEIVAPEVHP